MSKSKSVYQLPDGTWKKAIYQLPDGTWTHVKTAYVHADELGACMDYRFTCELENIPSNSHTESDFQ